MQLVNSGFYIFDQKRMFQIKIDQGDLNIVYSSGLNVGLNKSVEKDISGSTEEICIGLVLNDIKKLLTLSGVVMLLWLYRKLLIVQRRILMYLDVKCSGMCNAF